MSIDEREELTPLQAAMIEHDDDMARLDRNTPTPAQPDQFEFWLDNYWPDWRKGNQDSVELMRAAWMATMRLANFNELALKGAINYTLELETRTNATASAMRDKCAEKVIAYFGGLTSMQVNRDELVAAIEALTLDQVERS